MISSLLNLLVSLTVIASSSPAGELRLFPADPSMDISAIRYIECGTSKEDIQWTGSGFLIGDHEIMTAYHLAEGSWMNPPKSQPKCYDASSGEELRAYKLDRKHDEALMTGDTPTNIPYVKYDCSRPVKDQTYIAYGITDYDQPTAIVRNNAITATDTFTTNDDTVKGIPSPGIRVYNGVIAPGMSGGPIADVHGVTHAIVDMGSNVDAGSYDLADGAICTGKWDK